LIDAQHVLTAGHCACGRTDSYRVSFEQQPLSGTRIRNEIVIEGEPILFDRFTCATGPLPGRDLALLKISATPAVHRERYGYPKFVLAWDLRDQLMPGTPLKVVGYGETETAGVAVRMKAHVPILTPNCLTRPYNRFCAPFLEMILADRTGNRTPRDTCGGDSGGPVFVTVKMPACGLTNAPIIEHEVLVGITSRAAPFTHAFGRQHCGGGGIYTVIGRRSVHEWLAKNGVKPQQCIE
jgi:hypothetical protein